MDCFPAVLPRIDISSLLSLFLTPRLTKIDMSAPSLSSPISSTVLQ